MNKMYPITSICKQDVLNYFRAKYSKTSNWKKIEKIINNLSDEEMKALASKLSSDYLEQMHWNSLELIFYEMFQLW